MPLKLRVKSGSFRIFVVACVFSILLNVILYLTYPINIGESDDPNYLAMIITGSSNLMHASGYPAILHLLTHPFMRPVLIPNRLPSDIPADWFNELQAAQLLLHAVLFSVSILLCVKIFGKPVATVLTIGWGSNLLFMSNVNATAPEWLQADTLILSILMHAYARALAGRKKVLVYCAAAAVFTMAYLIKYNSMLFAITLVGFLLLDKESRRFKVLQLLSSVAVFLAVTSAYANFYHQKSTGTTQLTFDHAWVMIEALPSDYLFRPPERLGVSSLRWIALSSITPPDYFRAEAVEHIRYGAPSAVRQRYKKQLESVFGMSKPELIQFVKGHPLPTSYSPGSAAVPLYYYYGLEATDELGIQVYIESVQSDWRDYLKRIGAVLWRLFANEPSIHAVPTFTYPLGYKFLPPDFNARSSGASRIVPPAEANPYFLDYYNPTETVSFYGMKIIDAFDRLTSHSLVYVALNVISLLGLFTVKSSRNKTTVFCILAGLLTLIAGSAMLALMRKKELIAITPVYFCLISFGLTSLRKWLAGVSGLKSTVRRHPVTQRTG